MLEGEEQVLALIEHNPFPDRPPNYLRAHLFDYRFSDPAAGDAWWQRTESRVFLPPVTIESFRRR